MFVYLSLKKEVEEIGNGVVGIYQYVISFVLYQGIGDALLLCSLMMDDG